MENIYSLAIDLLGKSIDDISVSLLAEKAEENPKVIVSNDIAAEYLFQESGLQYVFDKNLNQFSSVFFHLDSAMVSAGEVERYSGRLPRNVLPGENSSAVEKKFGSKPFKSRKTPGIDNEQRWDYYKLDSFEATFIFDELNDVLVSASLRLPGGL